MPATPTIYDLDNLALSNRDLWEILIVTGGARLPFESGSSYDAHPLKEHFDSLCYGKDDKHLYSLVMKIHATKLGLINGVIFAPEMTTVFERIIAALNPRLHWPDLQSLKSPSLGHYVAEVMEEAMTSLASAFFDVAGLVAMGVPLYRLGSDRESDTLVLDGEQPSAYMSGKWTYQDTSSPMSSLPEWVHQYGFKNDELNEVELFFSENVLELMPKQIAARRSAYRTHIGYSEKSMPKSNNFSNNEGSSLICALQEVRRRYYGSNFSAGDRQTWPRQKDIVDWLEKDKGLSQRQAVAVELVARPDVARST